MPTVIYIGLIVLPWLNPFAFGPSPAVLPWLVTVAATGSLILLKTGYSCFDVRKQPKNFVERWASPAASAWLVAGVASSLMGLLQYFGLAVFFDPWINQSHTAEAFANLRQRNQFATLTNMALAALIWLAATGRLSAPAKSRLTQSAYLWLTLGACCVLALGNAASSSRTGLMELVLLCLIFGLWGAWRQPLVSGILLTAVAVYALASLLLPIAAGFDLSIYGMMARLRSGDQPCSSRLTLWSNVLHLIGQKPWLGWGWGELAYAHYATLYSGNRFCDILDNAHNLPLQLAVELGVPAALLLCGGFVWWALRQKPWRESHPNRQLAWTVLAVILLHSMLEYPLWYGPFQVAAVLCVGLLWRFKNPANKFENKSNNTLVLIFQLLGATVSLIFCTFAIWDYNRVSQIYLVPEARNADYRAGTLEKIQGSWLFAQQVSFAKLMLTPLTLENAQWAQDTADQLLHYSPEPRVIEKVIESATLLGRDDEALVHLARYKAAFPTDHAHWAMANNKAR